MSIFGLVTGWSAGRKKSIDLCAVCYLYDAY